MMPSTFQSRNSPARMRRDAGYAILEAMPPLIACGFLGTVIAAGLLTQAALFASSSGDPTAGDAITPPSTNATDNSTGLDDRPTPLSAERRFTQVTRDYEERLASAGNRSGTAFHGVPGSDFTGNGNPDIMVTKPRATNILDGSDPTGGFGSVEIWTLWSSSAVRTLHGLAQNDLFGLSAKSAGDLDGDGADDIIVGAMLDHGDSGLEGAVYVFSGSDGQLLLTITGEEWEYLGRTVAGASDVDGDGQWDIAVSSWVYESHQAFGMVSLHSGSDGALIRTYTSDLPNDGFGYEVISLGDLDGDTRSEIAVSASLAPGHPLAFAPAIGRIYIFDGLPRAAEPEHLDTSHASLAIYNPDPLITHFGIAIERTTDQDGDGVPDLLVTSLIDPYDATLKTTTMQVYSSSTGNLLWPVQAPGHGTGREGEDTLPAVDENGEIIHYSHYTTGLGVTGDTTRDLRVEQEDLLLVAESFGQDAVPGNPVSGDLSLSGSVDLADLNSVIHQMNRSSVVHDFVDDTHRLLTRWSALDPYQYGDYVTGQPGRGDGNPARGGAPSPMDPVYAFPDPYFPGVFSKTHPGIAPCRGFINHPACGSVADCVVLCCGLPECGPTDSGAGGGGPGGGGPIDSNGNGIPDNVDCASGGRPVPPPGCIDPCGDDDGDGIPNQYDCDSPCFDSRYTPIGSDGLPCDPCADVDGVGIRNQMDCDSNCSSAGFGSGIGSATGRLDCDPNCDHDGDGIPNRFDCDSPCYDENSGLACDCLDYQGPWIDIVCVDSTMTLYFPGCPQHCSDDCDESGLEYSWTVTSGGEFIDGGAEHDNWATVRFNEPKAVVVTVSNGCCRYVHSVAAVDIQLNTVVFGENMPLHRDLTGEQYGVGTGHWKRPATLGGDPEVRVPVVYRRGSSGGNDKVRVGVVTLDYQGPSILDPTKFAITATATVSGGGFESGARPIWVTDGMMFAVNIETASRPSMVGVEDDYGIEWRIYYDGLPVGCHDNMSSGNQMYFTYDDPMSWPYSGNKLYHTAVDIGCRSAAGADGGTSHQSIVDLIYQHFQGRDVRRAEDNKQMTYWLTVDDPPVGYVPQGIVAMLQDSNADGSCVSWAELMCACIRAQGVSGAKVWPVRPKWNNAAETQIPFMLIPEWFFTEAGTAPSSRAPFTHTETEIAVGAFRVPSQGNPNSPHAFENHWLLVYGSKIYDPSYGSGTAVLDPVDLLIDYEQRFEGYGITMLSGPATFYKMEEHLVVEMVPFVIPYP